jgi:transposase
MTIKHRRKYDPEFKTEAVRLVLNGRTTQDVAANLGISYGMLARWKREFTKHTDDPFSGQGKLRSDDERFRQLERELLDVKEERDILKKRWPSFQKK